MKVGSYVEGASIYGALDMVGNVREWTADWYADDYYYSIAGENPTGPDSGEFRTIRDPFGYQVARKDLGGNPDSGGVRRSVKGFHGDVKYAIAVSHSGSPVTNRQSAFPGVMNLDAGFEFVFVLRVTYRYGAPPNLADYNLGFRCAASP